MNPPRPRRTIHLAHDAVRSVVQPGDHVVDATAGNGHDTVFLAELVGEGGLVTAFDIQDQALATTWQRLETAELKGRVALVHQGHETMVQHCEPGLAAVMFNLGYLPSADHAVITTEKTTLSALEQAFSLLKEGGMLTCLCYPGHPGGEQEAETVTHWFRAQSNVAKITGLADHSLERPFLLTLHKQKGPLPEGRRAF